jgi:hypothetical protein
MVNMPILQRIRTELAPVNHLVNNGNGASRPKRKRMANCGFMRSDLWSRKHGYSYNTVNKYRGVLYGDEAFLPPTPTTGGRIRIANEVADKLRDHGVRPRNSEASKRRPSCAPRKASAGMQPVTPDGFAAWLSKAMDNPAFTQAVVTMALAKHDMTRMLEMLIEAEAEIVKHCPDCTPKEEEATS